MQLECLGRMLPKTYRHVVEHWITVRLFYFKLLLALLNDPNDANHLEKSSFEIADAPSTVDRWFQYVHSVMDTFGAESGAQRAARLLPLIDDTVNALQALCNIRMNGIHKIDLTDATAQSDPSSSAPGSKAEITRALLIDFVNRVKACRFDGRGERALIVPYIADRLLGLADYLP